MNFINKVYPFTTENINGYIHNMDLKDKTLLTLGSSLDQAFNALVLGAKNICVYDININVEDFYKLKRNLILNNSRNDLYSSVVLNSYSNNYIDITDSTTVFKYNYYMQSDDNYECLRDKLKEDRISFVKGNIFKLNESLLEDEKYDRIILSNALQYMELYGTKKDKYKVLKDTFKNLKMHLNKEGIIQLLYYYNTGLINVIRLDDFFDGYNLNKILNTLYEDSYDITGFSLLEFDDGYGNHKDGAVLYKKR